MLFFQNGLPYGRDVERVVTFIELPGFFNFYVFRYGVYSVVFYLGDLFSGFKVHLVSCVRWCMNRAKMFVLIYVDVFIMDILLLVCPIYCCLQ